MSTGVSTALLSVWGSGPSDVWAVGYRAITHWNGTMWTPVAAPAGSANVYAIWGTATDDVWAAGDAFWHWDGHTWTEGEGASSITSLWGSGPSDIWAVGSRGSNVGTMMHWNGMHWAAFSDVDHGLGHIWGAGANDVWAVGSGGAVLHFDGAVWSPVVTVSNDNFTGVWGSTAEDVWVVGANHGTIIHHP
jgi:hypothetical protein